MTIYLLKPIGPNGESFEFDTDDIFHLSKLERSDEGVVYFDGVPYTIESKPGYKVAPDLLAVAEKLDEFQRNFEIKSYGNKMPGNELYSGLLMEIVNEARAAIAAAKGE